MKGDIQGKTHVIDTRSVGVHHVTMMMNVNREDDHRGMSRTIDTILETDAEIRVIADTMIVDMMIADMMIVDIVIVRRIIEETHLVTDDRATEEIRIQEVEIHVIELLTIEILAIKVHDPDLTPVVDHHEIGNENCQTLTTRVEIIIR